MIRTYYIKLPDREAHQKAIEVFMDQNVNQDRLVFPNHVMGVSLEHIQALERANVPFVMNSGRKWNGQGATSIQS